MANNKAVIFDMDGVLIDSEKLWQQAEKETFSALGVHVTREWAAITQSMTTAEATRFWYERSPWPNMELPIVEQMVVSRVIDLIETEACFIPGVKGFVEWLKKRKYKIGLATNSPQRVIPIVLKKLGLLHLFDAVSSAEYEQKGKPDPSIYYSTAKKLNVLPQNCLAIEDSHSGILAAKNAGMKVVAFTGCQEGTHFEMADFTIDNFESLPVDTLFDL